MTEPVDRADLAERLAFVVGTVTRRLRPPAEGLTHVGLSALASIARAGTIRPGDLARIEGIAAPAMTRQVADLDQRGLVAREADPDDGRSHLLRVTPAGQQAIVQARHERATTVAELLADTGEDDLLALRTGVAALEAALLRTPAQQRIGRAG